MSKKDLIDAVAKEAELTKEKASVAVDAVLEHIRGAMRKGEEVRIPDFGTFKVAKRKAREGPQSGDRRDDQHPGLARAQVQPLQGPEGPAQLADPLPPRRSFGARRGLSVARLCVSSPHCRAAPAGLRVQWRPALAASDARLGARGPRCGHGRGRYRMGRSGG